MDITADDILASPCSTPDFEFTVVFMLEHSEGALGVVLTVEQLPVTDMFDGGSTTQQRRRSSSGGPVSLSSVIALGVAASAGQRRVQSIAADRHGRPRRRSR